LARFVFLADFLVRLVRLFLRRPPTIDVEDAGDATEEVDSLLETTGFGLETTGFGLDVDVELDISFFILSLALLNKLVKVSIIIYIYAQN